MRRWIDWFFRLEEINGGYQCPTYLYRWTLFRLPWLTVYLHHFVADDWARDMHDHPKRFISIGLWGSYVEETPTGSTIYQAPWIRTFPAEHIHRLRLLYMPGSLQKRSCWTIAIVGPAVRQWGFWVNGRWMQWRRYIVMTKSQASRNCPE